jgi:hypothetical protein
MKAGKMICRLVKDIVGHEVWYLNPKKKKIIRYIDNWILIYHLNIEPILKILHSLQFICFDLLYIRVNIVL